MIVLDTNVLSEPVKAAPSPLALRWLQRQAPDTLFTTTICVAELFDGVARLPAGRRREQLALMLSQRVLPLFNNRVLAFDLAAGHALPGLRTAARAAGLAAEFADSQIAAIASVYGFTVATRDVTPFRALGVPVIDPWAENA